MTKRVPKITLEEVGQLQIVHRALSHMIEKASSKQLAERLERAFQELPSSNVDGLKLWP